MALAARLAASGTLLDALSRHTVKSGLTRAAGLCIFYVFSVVLMYFCEKAVRRGIA